MKDRRALVTKDHQLSMRQQCDALSINRSSLYYEYSYKNESEIKEKIGEIYSKNTSYGYRKVHDQLVQKGEVVNSKKVLRLMRAMNIRSTNPSPKTSIKDYKNTAYPYLLRGLSIYKPHQVWQVDITYIKTPHGFIYLTALIDVFSRAMVGYRISNDLCAETCVAALEDAIHNCGVPEIVNSDHGSQFTGKLWIDRLTELDISISMNGKRRSIDNVHIERLWWTVKYEWLFLHDLKSVSHVKLLLKDFAVWYNQERPHQALNYQTPAKVLKNYGCGNVENSSSFHTVPLAQQQHHFGQQNKVFLV